MFEVFKQYGLVLEVAIPPKGDKCGKRFGFVRFKNVEDIRLLAIKLDIIMIRERKIYGNILKLHRGSLGNEEGVKNELNQKNNKWAIDFTIQAGAKMVYHGKTKPSYTQVLGVGQANMQEVKRSIVRNTRDWLGEKP
ncbi:unnamed protein product [Lathyrus sativus]|nr:unnamed protein product [Lathyrus sativus]